MLPPQASEVMRGGPMTQERSQYLEELRLQLGVSRELADKVLKAAKSEVRWGWCVCVGKAAERLWQGGGSGGLEGKAGKERGQPRFRRTKNM